MNPDTSAANETTAPSLPAPAADGFRRFLIVPDKEPALRVRLAQLVKRALRCGVTPPEVVWGEIISQQDPCTGAPVGRMIVRKQLAVRETPVVLGGWRHVATLAPHESGANIVREVPGETCPTRYRSAAADCDHCKTDRRRNETFVFTHQDGRHVQIGRTCLVDYFGHRSAAYWAECAGLDWAIDDAEIDEDEGGGGYGGPGRAYCVKTAKFLEVVCACVRKYGYLSAKAAQDSATSRPTTGGLAWDHFFGNKAERFEVTPADEARAAQIMAWAATLGGVSNYEHNLRLLIGAETVDFKGRGYVASAGAAYDRAMGIVHERAARKPSAHVGTVDARGLFAVRVMAGIGIESDFGSAILYVLRSLSGDLIAWKTSGSMSLTIGSVYVLRGTVKRHGDYKGEAQTTLARCTVEIELGQATGRGETDPAAVVRDAAVEASLAAFAASKETAKSLRTVRVAIQAAQAAYLTSRTQQAAE